MKVPTLTNNRVAEGGGKLAYLQTPSNLGQGTEMLARSLSSLGSSISGYEAQLREREDKTKRFNALTAVNQFETERAEEQFKLKREADPSGKDFALNANRVYTKAEQEFLAQNIPEDMREEFKARLSQNKQQMTLDAFDFQYKAGDAWFRKGVNDTLNGGLTAVEQDPDALEAQQTKVFEAIDATDLSEIEKEDLKEKSAISLASVKLKQKIKEDALNRHDAGLGEINDGETAAMALIIKEENFRPHAYWDKTAWRTGYGSDTTTRADGSHETITKETMVTREDADRDIRYRLKEREGKRVREQVGENWEKLSPSTQAALYSVGYNYGSLPKSVERAVATGDRNAIADAIGALDANPDRRRREAALVRGDKSLDLDEEYSKIPFDDRVKIRKQAEYEAQQEYNDLAQQRTTELKAAQNDLMVGLYDGTKGPMDIQVARDSGILTDYDDIAKANKILEDKQGETRLSTDFNWGLITGKTYDPTDEDSKKGYNAWVKSSGGLEKLQERDQEYFNQYILPSFQQLGAMAPDVAGLFQGMVRGGDPKRRTWALDALAVMRDVNKTGFESQIPEAIQRQVDYWDEMKGSVEDPKMILEQMDGQTAAERQRRDVLKKQAEGILSATEGGVPGIETLMTQVIEAFDDSSNPFVADPHPYNDPMARQSMYAEFQTEFVKEYQRWGNAEKATEAAIKTMKSSWDVAVVGDGKTIMKYPPQKVGYQPSGGSYEWINQQIRSEFKLKEGETFELFSDDKTRQEWEKFRAGQGLPPSYRVMLRDANGVPRDSADAGGVRRIYFQKPPELKAREEAAFDLKNEIQTLSERLIDIVEMKMQANTINTGKSLPQEIVDEEAEIRERLDQLKGASDPFSEGGEMPATDAMGNPI